MKDIYKDEELVVPENVKVTIKSREINVEGPRGVLKKSIKHINLDIRILKTLKQTKIRLIIFHGSRAHIACLRTVKSILENMIAGVTKGFSYKLRSVYAHFPINVIVQEEGKKVEIRNFLGEKLVRQVPMLEGVTISESSNQKDEYVVQGNDVESVSQSAASIHQSCLVKKKDIRKFLDGIYVSEKGHVVQDD